MTNAEITRQLLYLDGSPAPQIVNAVKFVRRIQGESCPWIALLDDGNDYVIKYPDNPQEQHMDALNGPLPQKVVVSELICGRLGQLFTPPVTPFTCVVDVPERVVAQQTQCHDAGLPLPSGLSVGIRYVEGATYSKDQWVDFLKNPIDQVQLAGIVVFMLWLNALDPEIQVATDVSRLYSIDYGWYFTGNEWKTKQLQAKQVILSPKARPTFYQPLGAHVTTEAMQDALAQLSHIREGSMIAACARIPPAWGADEEFLGLLASFVLRRRESMLELTAPEVVAALMNSGIAP
jgi:HipA-like kinase